MKRTVAAAAALLLLAPVAGAAQDFRIETDLRADRFIPRSSAVTLRFSRPLDATSERIAFFLGSTDATDMFVLAPGGAHYDGALLGLPPGETELIVQLVRDGGAWQEIARLPLRVTGRFGMEKASAKPTLSIGLNSRFAQESEPPVAPDARATYNDLSAQFGIETEHVRSGVVATSRMAVVAMNERTSALRFGQLGAEAPLVDLSAYQLQLNRGRVGLHVGDVNAGGQRHLINGFASRGASLRARPGGRVEAAVTAQNGSRVVGWDNLFGMEQPEHRMVSAAVGIEALPHPGGLRLDLHALDGSVLPRAGFNQGSVSDAEQSRGAGVRVQANVTRLRLRLDGGFTRSMFTNPHDPLLAGAAALVPVRAVTENARYLDAAIDLVRNRRLFGRRTLRLGVNLAHERVDPLFRSVAAYTRADQLQNQLQLRGDVAGVAVSAGHVRSENNLDGIASILTSQTRRSTAELGIPVAQVLGVAATPWLPAGRYRYDRTQQAGTGLPSNGGFEPSHVPDQLSRVHSGALHWQWRRLSLSVEHADAFQDNRQPGREQADFRTRTTALSLTARPARQLSLNAQAGLVTADNLERGEADDTRRWGVGLDWSPTNQAALALRFNDTGVTNAVLGTIRDAARFEAQWSAAIPRARRAGGTWFVRYARNTDASINPSLQLDDRRRHWWLDGGFNFSF